MINTQPAVAGIIISFAARAAAIKRTQHGSGRSGYCLTPLDRIDIVRWHDTARQVGYDRMVIHDRDIGDALEVGTFLSVYCSGESWSRWGFARRGDSILAWCCLSGADIGEFACLSEALATVLLGKPANSRRGTAAAMIKMSRPDALDADAQRATVTNFMPKLPRFGGPMGGAA